MSSTSSNPAARPATLVKPAPPLHHHLLNLPNSLTLCRIALIPFFVAMLSRVRMREALYLFAAAA
jgi:phosphatidylglycerophosphate synthase